MSGALGRFLDAARALGLQPETRRFPQGTKTAEAAEAEYTTGDYLRQLDGLGYQEIVTFTDPTGKTADRRFRQVYEQLYGRGPFGGGGNRNGDPWDRSERQTAWRGTPVGTPGGGNGWDPSR